MSYLYYPTGVPGTGLTDGAYPYTSNIHITDGSTSVNSASIRDGIGREIAVLQNYLGQINFMSGNPIGTGYFYSLGTSDNPLDYCCIINANVFRLNAPDTTDSLNTTDTNTQNITVNKAVLGDNLTSCVNHLTGIISGLNFSLKDGVLFSSGYWDSDNNIIIDTVGVSGNYLEFNDTPDNYLTAHTLDDTDDYHVKSILFNRPASGLIENLYISGQITSPWSSITSADPKLIIVSVADSTGFNPFFSAPYMTEDKIYFDDTAGHAFGEGDLSLLDGTNVIISGATFNNLTWSGYLSKAINWDSYINNEY